MGLLKSTLNDMVVAFTMKDVFDNKESIDKFKKIIQRDGLFSAAQKEKDPKRRKRDSLFNNACSKYLDKKFDLKLIPQRFIISAPYYGVVVILAFVTFILYLVHVFWCESEIFNLVRWSAVRAFIVLVVYILLFRTVYGLLFKPPSGSDELDNDAELDDDGGAELDEDSNSKSKKLEMRFFVRDFYLYMCRYQSKVVARVVVSGISVILFISACVDFGSLLMFHAKNETEHHYFYNPQGDTAKAIMIPLFSIYEYPTTLFGYPELGESDKKWARKRPNEPEENDASTSEQRADQKTKHQEHWDKWNRTVLCSIVFYDIILCFPTLLIGLIVSFFIARRHRPDYSEKRYEDLLKTEKGFIGFDIADRSHQVTAGDKNEIEYSVKRYKDCPDPVDLTFTVPATLKGVTIGNVQITKGTSKALVTLTTTPDATVGNHMIKVHGVSEMHSKQIEGKAKLDLEVVSTPIFGVVPFVISEVSCQVTAGDEKEIKCSVERKDGFVEPVDLTFTIPDALNGVTVTKVQFAKNISDARVKLIAATDATVGKYTIDVVGVSEINSEPVTANAKIILEVVCDELDRICLVGLNSIGLNEPAIQSLLANCKQLELIQHDPKGHPLFYIDDDKAGYAVFIDINFRQLAGEPRQQIRDAGDKGKNRVFIILTGKARLLKLEKQANNDEVTVAKKAVKRITDDFKIKLGELDVSPENIYDQWDHSCPTEDTNNLLREFLTKKCKAISNTLDTSPTIIGKYKKALAFLKKHAQQSVKPQEWVTVFEEAMIDLYSEPSADWKSVAEKLYVDALNKGKRLKTDAKEAAQKGKDYKDSLVDFWNSSLPRQFMILIKYKFAKISPTDSEDESADEGDDIRFSRAFYECIGIVILYEICCFPTDEFVTKFNKLFPRKLICPLEDEDQQRVVSELIESLEKEN